MKRSKEVVHEDGDGALGIAPPDPTRTQGDPIHGERSASAELFGPAADNGESSVSEGGIEAAPLTRVEVSPSAVVITIELAAEVPPAVTSTPRSIQIVQTREVKGGKRELIAPRPTLHVRISQVAFNKVRETVGALPAERGGIFVGPDPFCVEDFIFDCGSNSGRAVYFPDTKYLNRILESDHEPHGRRFVGLAHSHPNGYWRPSGDETWGDVKAARNNLLSKSNSDLKALFIPIVESAATSGRFVLHAFVMLRDFRVHPARYEVID